MPRDKHQVSDQALVTVLLFNLLLFCSHNDRSFFQRKDLEGEGIKVSGAVTGKDGALARHRGCSAREQPRGAR